MYKLYSSRFQARYNTPVYTQKKKASKSNNLHLLCNVPQNTQLDVPQKDQVCIKTIMRVDIRAQERHSAHGRTKGA